MNLKRILLTYLAGYLSIGGLGLTAAPDFFLKLLLSNQDYGDIMPRVVGVFMLVLAGFVGMILYYKDYKYFVYSIVARTTIVIFLVWFYFMTKDPFFIVINGIVLVGLLPSYFAMMFREKK